ncbi:L-threonine O-3-phosphate decarboxylase /adenosylcobyric acid synthase (glutamine-hydrolysing) [Paucidesulfovibrio gracilis DSM 16080]|uniref:Cobyric acid synthase n=1 Tax=Paucidesulfovibrio gracilis DSM 16080 TaxID=1121449 RepID=A0A1T4Y7X0_9BACT|nr:cobyric acid synthase [Paucidesulfovibrio gracilis]SKA97907.1 L-threonine O-3-phosphate decarboxylase /adenosylcobyric acid synthase (glutamine-hydrolysing) [Paucidesulfovibrio gracilis DSM 16080]
MKPLTCGKIDTSGAERYAHGGDVRVLAQHAGCEVRELDDFSASLNPLGPPSWLERELARAALDVTAYPDPTSRDVCLAACELYKVWPTQVCAGNGASGLFPVAVRAAVRDGFQRAVIPAPSYADYERACELAGMRTEFFPLDPEQGFAPDFRELESRLNAPALIFLCSPNNPTGNVLDATRVRELAESHPQCRFLVDESFADFVPGMDRLVRKRPDNLLVIHSLTKFFAIPGLRLGLAFGAPELILPLQKSQPEWSVNVAAQRVGASALRDLPYQAATRAEVQRLREDLELGLGFVPGIRVFPSQANFLLCRIERLGQNVRPLFEKLLSQRIAIRPCANFRGLDDRYFRVAVRTREQNQRLCNALEVYFGLRKPTRVVKKRRTPAIMLQGTCSNAGKSVLAAALCRIFLQDGLSVAPFKAQNMSLNSFVTRDGREMGRAQVTQAMACRLEPDARMNPVLLKPGSDTGSQVIVNGRPVGNMNVGEYVRYKPRAFEQVQQAYDSLAAEHDVIVIEGAGSPAEINLKAHDIVNMKMAEYADANVLLVGDIDRGGVFAALVGTMDLLDEPERRRVAGYVLNRFRGDPRLLDPALSSMVTMTGKEVLGVVPYIHNLGLPEEDSVSFKAGEHGISVAKHETTVDVACIDLGHISNFNDLDPLQQEPDVTLRVVRTPHELGQPDAVILPGSKSTVADMRQLKGAGMLAALRALPETTILVGICGGFQMLGTQIADPLGLESGEPGPENIVDGFGFLDLRTALAPEKTLQRTLGTHLPSGHGVFGYEIHHGRTQPLSQNVVPVLRDTHGNDLGYGLPSGRVWGTYLHGVFDDDGFRRWFVNHLRGIRGLEPLHADLGADFGLETALDHLAAVVREHLDMPAIYRSLGFAEQASLLR